MLLLALLAVVEPGQSQGKSDPATKALEEGDRLLRTGFPVLARRQYGEALKAGAPVNTVKLRMVHTYCATGDFKSADKELEELLKSKRPANEALLFRARIRFWQHRYDASWRWFRDYLKWVPGDENARMDYALSLAWGHQFDDALVEMNKLETSSRYRLESKFYRAQVLAWKKEYGSARVLANGLLGQSSASISLKARCIVLVGRTYAWERQFDEAIKQYRRALDTHPHSEEAWMALGEVLEWQGNREEAKASYARALQVAPSSKKARSALKRLTGQ